MDKKYLLSDGRTKIVPLEFEQQFLNQLEKQNLTAELITELSFIITQPTEGFVLVLPKFLSAKLKARFKKKL